MEDFQQQLRTILGDPEAMSRITALARTLTGGSPSAAPSDSGSNSDSGPDSDFIPVEQNGPDSSLPSAGDTVPDVSALLAALGGGDGTGPDPRLLRIAGTILSAYQAEDREADALLAALKPFLSPTRQEKVEKARQLTRLTRALRSGLRLWQEETPSDV